LREVSPSEIRALVDSRLEEGVFPGTPAVWREWLDQMPLPNAQPAFDRMLVSSDGAIWLRRFELHLDRASTWEVLRADGVYLTDVRVPQGLELMAIESTTVAGVVHDSLDIEHIVVHRLNRDETANQ
jgi:hypothetical protein